MSRGSQVAIFVCLLLNVVLVSAVSAQTADPRRRHHLEVTAGGLWLGGAAMGTDIAQLRANRIPPAPFTLFTTTTRVAAAPGLDGRLGFWLTRSIAVEAGFVYARPPLRTRVSADVEGAPALTIKEDIDQYFVDGNVVWLIERFRFKGRTVPFVSGGAGYLRQLHEGRTLVETGQVYHVGAGLRHWLRVTDWGKTHGMGVRLEGRAYVLANGVQFNDRSRTHAALSGSFFVTF